MRLSRLWRQRLGWTVSRRLAGEEVVGLEVPDACARPRPRPWPARRGRRGRGAPRRSPPRRRAGAPRAASRLRRAVMRRGRLAPALMAAPPRPRRAGSGAAAVGGAVLGLQRLRAARPRAPAPISSVIAERAQRPVEAEPHRRLHVLRRGDLLFAGEGRLVGDLGEEAGEDLGRRPGRSAPAPRGRGSAATDRRARGRARARCALAVGVVALAALAAELAFLDQAFLDRARAPALRFAALGEEGAGDA